MNKKCKVCGFDCNREAKFCSECGAKFPALINSYDAFISYRRDGGSELATLLQMQLETRFKKHVFLDIQGLQGGRFDGRVLEILGNTPNFILILSGDCLKHCADTDSWLRREILHAFKTQRNIIPIRVDGFEFPSASELALLPEATRVLPTLDLVEYPHVHGESAIRRVAEYLTPSGATPEKINKP